MQPKFFARATPWRCSKIETRKQIREHRRESLAATFHFEFRVFPTFRIFEFRTLTRRADQRHPGCHQQHAGPARLAYPLFKQELRAEGADDVIRCRRRDHKADLCPGQQRNKEKKAKAISPTPIHIGPCCEARPGRPVERFAMSIAPRATFFITWVTVMSPPVPAKTTTAKEARFARSILPSGSRERPAHERSSRTDQSNSDPSPEGNKFTQQKCATLRVATTHNWRRRQAERSCNRPRKAPACSK